MHFFISSFCSFLRRKPTFTVSMLMILDLKTSRNMEVCLRIDGVEYREKETSEDVLVKVKGLITASGSDIPGSVINRAHRVGKHFVDKNTGHKIHAIIVRFSIFRH